MTLWRLELLRLVRTHRWTILIGVYIGFAVLGAFSARYMNDILARFAGDVVVEFPEPRPVDGLVQFIGNVSQLGVLAVVIVASGALAMDARPEAAAFLRTRVERTRILLWPRYTVVTVVAVLSLALGTATTWGLTEVLIGSLPTGPVVIGTLLGGLYLAFAVAVVAAVAGFTPGATPTVFLSLLVLLALPALGLVPPVAVWLPSHLVAAVAGLVEGEPTSEYLRAAAVTAVVTPALLAAAAARFERREL